MKTNLLKFLTASALSIIITLTSAFSVFAEAVGDTDAVTELPDITVYCSPTEQEYVYQLVQNARGLIGDAAEIHSSYYDRTLSENRKILLLKESITPVYQVCLADYARTGKLKLNKNCNYLHLKEDNNCQQMIYFGKTVTEDGQFAGNVQIVIHNGEIVLYAKGESEVTDLPPSPESNPLWKGFPSSKSYADHAKRIQALLGSDSIIPPSDVRFVFLTGGDGDILPCFYIQYNGKEYLTPFGSERFGNLPTGDERVYCEGMLIDPTSVDFIEMSQEQVKINEKFIDAVEGLKKIYGDDWKSQSVYGGTQLPIFDDSLVTTDNINNIYEYFDLEQYYDGTETPYFPDNGGNTGIVLFIIIAAVILAAGVATAVLIFKKRAEKR